MTPQPGIFALGTASQCYIELSLLPGADPVSLVRALADFDEPSASIGGANVVIGFRPSLWAEAAPEDAFGAHDFERPIVGSRIQLPFPLQPSIQLPYPHVVRERSPMPKRLNGPELSAIFVEQHDGPQVSKIGSDVHRPILQCEFLRQIGT